MAIKIDYYEVLSVTRTATDAELRGNTFEGQVLPLRGDGQVNGAASSGG